MSNDCSGGVGPDSPATLVRALTSVLTLHPKQPAVAHPHPPAHPSSPVAPHPQVACCYELSRSPCPRRPTHLLQPASLRLDLEAKLVLCERCVGWVLIDSHERLVYVCGCPIWDFLCVPARYGAQFRGRLLGPRDLISPCPLRGSRPTQGRLNVPRLVGIARHPTRAMRQAVLNPVRNTCFVTGCNAGDERVGGRWCLCGLCVRWPADLLEPLPHVRGEVPQTGHHPPPQGGDESACGALAWGSAAFRGFSRPRLF